MKTTLLFTIGIKSYNTNSALTEKETGWSADELEVAVQRQ